MLAVVGTMLAAVLAAITNIATGPEIVPKSWAWVDNPVIVFGVLLGVLAAALIVAALLQRFASAPGPEDDLEGSRKALAAAVRRTWEPQAQDRRLHHPHPLPIRWTTVRPPVADRWATVRADGRDDPLELDGVLDTSHPDSLLRLATDPRLRGRLVILGDAGSGKTALLIRLTLTMLRSREPGSRVPVLLRLSTWNPDEQPLEAWITARLAIDYGFHGQVDRDVILPLLDGLDEIPQEPRRRAIRAINTAFNPHAPLVLTSRADQYRHSVKALTGRVLTGAAVVRLTAVPGNLVRAYLLNAAPADHADRWKYLFEQDRAAGGMVMTALSAPLWVDLVRMSYIEPVRPDNPANLTAFSSSKAIRNHLLGQLVPASYPALPGGDPDRRWSSEDAQRWLRRLAGGMHARGTQDIAWWGFARAMPPLVPEAFALVPAIACGLLGWLLLGGKTGLLLGSLAYLAFRLVVYLGPPQPSKRRVRLLHRGSATPLQTRLTRALLFGASSALWFGVGTAGILPPVAAVAVGVAGGLIGAALGGFTTTFQPGDADMTTPADPRTLLRWDRARALTGSVLGAVLAGGGGGVTAGLTSGPAAGLKVGIVAGAIAVLGGGIANSAWGWLQLSRAWLACTGQAPWRLMTFLDDAHQRGILRQTGAVYQFRHVLLRNRLAGVTESKTQDADTVTLGSA